MLEKLSSPLILASNSPRRKQILTEAGIKFTTLVKEIDEFYPIEILPTNVPEFLAHKKAKSYSIESENNIILTSDTVVILENEILGKPENEIQAKEMLCKLSEKKHTVITGICFNYKNNLITYSDTADVYFKSLSKTEIEYYVSLYRPLDKAGAYGIQEWIGMIGIEKINGSYFTVMGLPIHLVYDILKTKFSN
ncbi:MAG: septum formation protein Maf [Cytophagales bacterium]|nr:MAG: septum formation protein Maf [Cytophagales bacterium]TAH31117.1 MAG: septum formation protein Maf [Cytophagales bacterium]